MLYDRDALCRSLSFVYRMMVASAPLLRFAIERAEGELLDYYRQHLQEESDHDVMLLDDLHRLGVVNVPHHHGATQIAGSQYYLIAHEHPALLLGYMHALERDSLSVETVDALSLHHGTPLSCLRHHAEHDPHHKADLERMIGGLDERLRGLVAWNEQSTRQLLLHSLELADMGVDATDIATLRETLRGLSSSAEHLRFAALGDILTRYQINISSYQDSRARIASQVNEFSQDPEHPYFDEVSADILERLKADDRISLTQAYEDAVWANPETRQKEIARRQLAGRSATAAGADLRH